MRPPLSDRPITRCWAYCDNTGEPLAGMMRRGSAGSNTAEDHITIVDASIAALPPKFRRRLVVTADGAGASHGLITRLDQLAVRRGYELTYSVGWELGARERAAGSSGRRPGRSPSISAGRCASAGPLPPARTGPAGIRGAGWKKPTSPS